MKQMINGKPQEWDDQIQALWTEKVVPRIPPDQTCSLANYYTPRPHIDEYQRGDNRMGFVYTMQPANRVAFVQWEV